MKSVNRPKSERWKSKRFWVRAEGGARCDVVGKGERRLLVFTLFLFCVVFPGAVLAETPNQFVFMIDRSASMYQRNDPARGWIDRDHGSFVGEVEGARRGAQRILEQLASEVPNARVSLWEFGDRQKTERVGSDYNPSEALEHLQDLFSTDTGVYDNKRTYLSYALFEVTGKILGLAEDWTSDRDIPVSDGVVTVFVFTDGNEDVDPADSQWNEQYRKWLDRNGRAQLIWRRWQLFGTEPRPEPPPSDWITYRVLFPEPTLEYVNLSNWPEPPEILVHQGAVIRLIPDDYSIAWKKRKRRGYWFKP